MGQPHSRSSLITPGLVASSSSVAVLMQPCSWLQTIERGLYPALKGYLHIAIPWWCTLFLVEFHAFGMYIHNDTLLALGRQSDQFGDTGIPFRPVIGLLGPAPLITPGKASMHGAVAYSRIRLTGPRTC